MGDAKSDLPAAEEATPSSVPDAPVPGTGGVPGEMSPDQTGTASNVPADGVPADGVPADGVPADGVPADGVPADGVDRLNKTEPYGAVPPGPAAALAEDAGSLTPPPDKRTASQGANSPRVTEGDAASANDNLASAEASIASAEDSTLTGAERRLHTRYATSISVDYAISDDSPEAGPPQVESSDTEVAIADPPESISRRSRSSGLPPSDIALPTEPIGVPRTSTRSGPHPPSSDADRRPRTELSVDYASHDTFLFSYIQNISEMGIFIRSEDPFPVGTRLALRFAPEGKPPLELWGEVTWVNPFRTFGDNPNPGMGVNFIELTPDLREAIVELVRTVAYLRTPRPD